MEPASFTIGVAGLAGQLITAAMDCYKIFDDMNDIGSTYDAIMHELRTQGLLLKRWKQAWGFGGDSNQHQRLQPGDYRYRYATASLARIVAVFSSAEKLQERYGIVVEREFSVETEGKKRRTRFRDRLLAPIPVRVWSSKSRTQKSTFGPTKYDLHVLENLQALADTHILPCLEDEIKSMTKAMNRVQQSLPVYLKLRWVISDNAKLEELLRNLTSLNNGLFRVLPASESLLAHPYRSQGSSLKLSFDIPFFLNMRENCDFVGREYLLENLKQEIEKGKDSQNIIVLCGTGGMGKTQLALKYIYQQYGNYSSVFFVNTASAQTTIFGFIQIMQRLVQRHGQMSDDYSYIGQLLGMAGKLDPAGCFTITSDSEEQHVVSAVREWFAAPGNTNWLLVFDNLDDPDLVDIEQYIPLCNHGTVIITSRRRECIQQGRRGLEVQQMHHMESIQLLLRACSIPKFEDLVPVEKTAASTIAQELGYLPLALSQAGAYIHISQYSLSRYLKEYQTKAGYLLSKKWTAGQHDRSVFATWEISFKAIQEKSPKAAELFLVCGFFDHEDIQEELLRRGLKLKKHDHTLEESMRILFSYSLLKRGSSDDSFSIHPLIHSWARFRLKSEPQKEIKKAKEAFEIIASALHRSGEQSTADWTFEQQVMPHINTVTKHMLSQYLALSMTIIRDGACTLGNVFRRHGRYKQAMELYERALAAYEKALGIDHPDTLRTVNNMALIFGSQGQYEKALELYERALAGREKALGGGHPDTLSTVNNMASVLGNQGQYKKALELCERALAGHEKALGAGHPDTLRTVNNMALIFANQGQYGKALELCERALAGREKALGVDHPDTLRTVHNLALIFSNQGLYEKALELYERSLAGREKVLGVDHPDTLRTVNNMALIFANQEHYEKALEFCERALAGHEKALGINHPDTLHTVHNMALIFGNQGQHEKALELYERALAGYEKALGVCHPDTLRTIHNMALIPGNQGRYEKALELYERALAGREKALGLGHPDTLRTVNNMALIYGNQGRYEKALELYERTLAGREKALGVGHPDTLHTLHNMALIFGNQGLYDKALELYERVLAGYEKALGVAHPDTLRTVNNMTLVFDNRGQSEKALEWYGRALAGYEKALGVDHPDTLRTVNNIALIFGSQGRYGEALEFYQRALVGYEKVLGVGHPDTLGTVHNMALIFGSQGRYEKALELYEPLLAGREKALGLGHPDTLRTVHNMALIFDNRGQSGKALEFYERALSGYEKALGLDHPHTQNTLRGLIHLHERAGQTKQAQSLQTRLHALTSPRN